MIRIGNISFSYTGEAPYLLHNLSLDVKPGNYISIVGSNGSGKSTLLKLILGFLKPTLGVLENHARRTGYVPQAAQSDRGFPVTVKEVIDSYGKLLHLKNISARDILSRTGMEGFENELMGHLSGGQHQKVLIARALMGDPDLLILDEPSTGVDRESRIEIYKRLSRLNKEKHMTVIAVEHNLEAAVRHSSMLYHVMDGSGHLCRPDDYIREFIKEEGCHAGL